MTSNARFLFWLMAIGIAAIMPTLAYPHGAAMWIMEDLTTRHCCGPRDCHQVKVEVAPGGWKIVGVIGGDEVPHAEVPRVVVKFDDVTGYAKVPGFWACFYLEPRPDGSFGIRQENPVRCFFTPEAET